MARSILILVALLLSCSVAQAATWAETLFSELAHDFGAMPRGNVGMHTFTIANTTKQPVHIASVRVSCGCVTASIGKADLAPGEETYMVARIDSRVFAGVTHKTIFVLFDRPELSEVRIAVQANSRDDLYISPQSIAFGQVDRGSGPASNVTVSILRGGVKVTSATSGSAYIEPKVSAMGGDFQVTTKLNPDLPAGNWYTMVWLTTTDPALPRIGIPVTVDVKEPRAAPVAAR
jgi:hypothetical protein